jgi:ATP-dependent protease ClpP protease subunit
MDLEQLHEFCINVDTRTIYIHQIDHEDSVSHKTIPGLIKNLDYLNAINKSAIVIKSLGVDGGDVSCALAAYSVIKNSKAKVNIECYGFTASCGTIILQAGNTRLVSRDGGFMVHFGSISLSADINNAQSILASNALWKSQMLNIYSNRCINGEFFKDRKYGLSRVKTYLNNKLRSGDWYLKDAEEIIYYGFADTIM